RGPRQGPDRRGAGPRGSHGASLGRPTGSLADLRDRGASGRLGRGGGRLRVETTAGARVRRHRHHAVTPQLAARTGRARRPPHLQVERRRAGHTPARDLRRSVRGGPPAARNPEIRGVGPGAPWPALTSSLARPPPAVRHHHRVRGEVEIWIAIFVLASLLCLGEARGRAWSARFLALAGGSAEEATGEKSWNGGAQLGLESSRSRLAAAGAAVECAATGFRLAGPVGIA